MADNGHVAAAPSSNDGTEEKKKSKRPANSAFKQQRLPAWQPVMTAKTVIPAFFIIGIIFVPLGAVLYETANGVKEHVIDYTDKDDCAICQANLNVSHEATPCNCSITFTLPEEFKGTVYMYYGLDNFYQNHRRYVKSRDDKQLLGGDKEIPSKDLNEDCEPYKSPKNDHSLVYAPCGAIANSMFNDSLRLIFKGTEVPVYRTNIAWPSDKKVKFKNPEYSGDLCSAAALGNTIPPPNWPKPLCQLDEVTEGNNGYENEDLIVWMRTAALPDFRKLYRRINHDVADFANGLPAGDYVLDVTYNYPVKDFGGRKKMILSTTSWIGGKNPFLGIAYMTVGVICIVLAIVFLIIHFKCGSRTESMIEVNESTPYQQ